MKRRLLSLLLAFVMLFSLLPSAAFAAEPEEENVPSEESAPMEESAPAEGTAEEETPADEPSAEEPPEEDEPDAEEPSEEPGEEPAEEELPEEELLEAEPQSGAVRLRFVCSPEETVVTLWADGADEPLQPEEGGGYLLAPGDYVYSAACPGYLSVERQSLTLEAGEELREIAVTLEAAEETPDELEKAPPVDAIEGGAPKNSDKSGSIVDFGTCGAEGDNLTWTLYSDGNLVIAGFGAMADYSIGAGAPWYSIRNQVLNLTFSSGMSSIGNFAFRGCSKLMDVMIPGNVASIGKYAFFGCDGLKSVTIQEGVTIIGDSAFWLCDMLTEINYLGTAAQWSAIQVESYDKPFTSAIKHFSDVEAGVLDCRAINSYLFWYLTTDEILHFCGAGTIPNYSTSAPWYSYRSQILSVSIPYGVTMIGNYAFNGCSSLTSVMIPDSVTAIGNRAFSSCSSLRMIILEGDLPDISNYAFASVTATVLYPGNNPTYKADKLKNYGGTLTWKTAVRLSFDGNGGSNVPATMSVEGDMAVTIPTAIPIRTGAEFLGWALTKKASEADFLPGDRFIIEGNTTLYAVWRLIVKAQGMGAENISWILYEDGTLVISPADQGKSASIQEALWAAYKDEITAVVIADGVTEIGDGIFAGYSALESVDIPDSVTNIGADAFTGCTNLGDISIPEGTELGEGALDGVPTAPASFELDLEYLILKGGETSKLCVVGLRDDLQPLLLWFVENKNGTRDVNSIVIAVSEDGVVTAKTAGTAYVVAQLTAGGKTYTARCRVDVVKDDGANSIANALTGVRLPNTKATTELYNLNHTRITVVPELRQNQVQVQSSGSGGAAQEPECAIESAVFVPDENNAGITDFFELRVSDDRTLEIVPKDNAIANAGAVKGKYVSAIKIVMDGRALTTPEKLTLTVSKAAPKITAKAVKLNSFLIPADEQPVVFSGAAVAEVRLDTSKDNTAAGWLSFDASNLRSLTYAGDVDAKKSGKLNLLVRPEGWCVDVPVTLSVSAAKSAPKLALKPASVSLHPSVNDSVVSAVTVTPASFSNPEKWNIETLNIPDALDITIDGYAITVREGAAAPTDGKAHTYKVTLALMRGEGAEREATSVRTTLTVKLLASSTKIVLSAKIKGSIDTAIPESSAAVTLKAKGVSSVTIDPAADIVILREKAGETALDVTDRFVLTSTGPLSFTVKKAQASSLESGYTYTAHIEKNVGGNTVSCSIKLPVKFSAASKVRPSVTLKVTGTVDVVRPDSAITIMPSVKNCFTYSPAVSDLRVWKLNGKVYDVDARELFDIRIKNGAFIVKLKPDSGVDHTKDKFKVQLVTQMLTVDTDGNEILVPVESAQTAFTVKMGAVKLTQSAKTVYLLKTDRYSSGMVSIKAADTSLAPVDWEKTKAGFDAKNYGKPFDFRYTAEGKCVIFYTANVIPATLKNGTVKIPIFLEGNLSSKPNATITIKVIIK